MRALLVYLNIIFDKCYILFLKLYLSHSKDNAFVSTGMFISNYEIINRRVVGVFTGFRRSVNSPNIKYRQLYRPKILDKD